VGPEDTISLIYTSGTTGPPKGVVYSHNNVTWTLESIGRFWALVDQTLVSYLPLAHVAERFTSQWGGIFFGHDVWLCPDVNLLLPYLVEARPTEFVGVPRVWEKLMAGINAGIAADDRAKYTLAGGRLVKFGGEPAALVEFRMPNSRISLLVSSDKLASATGGKVTRSDGLSFHAEDVGEFHVATWDNKGLTYALISSIAMASSRSCSSCHRDSPAATAAMKSSHDTFLRAHPLPEISANQVNQFSY